MVGAIVIALVVVIAIGAGWAAVGLATQGIYRWRRDRNDAVLFEDCRRPFLNHVFRRLPASPRCRLCFAPFGGVGRWLGIRPSRKNPTLCPQCFERAPVGVHEMEIGVLFADVRGFTTLAEKQTVAETAGLLNRFYRVATDVLVAHDAIIDKLVGDEVMALFLPQFPSLGERTCEQMISTAEQLLAGVHDDDHAWLPLGVGLHFGPACVGNVGSGDVKDFTAVGDVVNTAARLQEEAKAGEILVSDTVYRRVVDRYPGAPRVELMLKGKSEPVVAWRLT